MANEHEEPYPQLPEDPGSSDEDDDLPPPDEDVARFPSGEDEDSGGLSEE
jgi:hypothetical protein